MSNYNMVFRFILVILGLFFYGTSHSKDLSSLSLVDVFKEAVELHKNNNKDQAKKYYLYIIENASDKKADVKTKSLAAYNLYILSINNADSADKIKWLKMSADMGHVEGQHFLGHAYEFGDGVKKDKAIANNWFLKAALQGESSSMYHYAHSLHYGRGIAKDTTEANKWFTKAFPLIKNKAKQGHPKSALFLYSMHNKGFGTPQNKKLAFEGYQYLADRGNTAAQYELGWLYYLGQGVGKNLTEARYWWTKASIAGHQGASHFLKKQGWD